MNGPYYLGGELLATPPSTYTVVGVGDFNGDGRPDLVFADSSFGNNIRFWYFNRARFLREDTLLGAPGSSNPNYHVVGVGDFNRDGKPDLLFQSAIDGQLVVWYMNGNNYAGGSALLRYPNSGWQVKAIADYNNDGWPDIVFQNATSGKVVIWFVNGLTFTGGDLTTMQPLAPYQVIGPH
jgi:hypothetical protein